MIDDRRSSSSEPGASDLAAAWQAQPTRAFRLSPAAIAMAEHEHARLRRGVMVKSAVMLFFLILALRIVVTVDIPLVRVGCLAMAGAYASVLHSLLRRRRDDADGAAAERAGAGIASPSFVHYRAWLVRERERLTGRRLWVPFAVAVPAGIALMLGTARARPALQQYVWLEVAVFAVAMPLAYVVGRRRARRLQTRIDEIDLTLSHGAT